MKRDRLNQVGALLFDMTAVDGSIILFYESIETGS